MLALATLLALSVQAAQVGMRLPATPGPVALPALPSAAFAAPAAAGPGPASPVPADFGAKHGTEIANKATILAEVDRALGRDVPPDVEMIFVRPLATKKIAGKGIGKNPYGHAVVRYTLPGGEQKTMNIVGKKGRELVNFMKPEDYLYSTQVFDSGSEQGGVYNRAMVSVRLEKVKPEQILALDKYYVDLKGRAERGEVKFSLALTDVLNFIAALIPGVDPEYGNCARWVSKGLAAAGLLKRPSLWPKDVFVTLWKKYRRLDPANVHVVSWRRPRHAVLTYGIDAETFGLYAPLRWLKSWRYYDLEKRADLIVEVPAGSTTAEVRAGPRRHLR